jgi:Skp family chaperone for outer membrane proteins
MSRNRFSAISIAVVAAIAATLLMTPSVFGTRAAQPSSDHRVATVDLLTLLEDMLQTEDYKPARDAFREEWEGRVTELQNQLQQIQQEIQMGGQGNPNLMQLQRRYQETGYQFQQLSQQAAYEFDQFNADQAAEAYKILNENAASLAEGMGYTHLIASREEAEITERGNLATVTQEILARPIVIAPQGDDLTDRLREKLSIPVPPEPADAVTEGVDAPGMTTDETGEAEDE